MIRARRAVLVHGFNLRAEGWYENVWGNPDENRLGRITKGFLVAFQQKADFVFLGTGASKTADGVIEAEATRQLLVNQFDKLSEFSLFAELDQAELRSFFEKLEIVTEITCSTTITELQAIGALLVDKNVTHVTLVSCATHAPRCLRDGFVVFDKASKSDKESGRRRQIYSALRSNLAVACSDVTFAGHSAAEVAIVEPPHRQDRGVNLPLYKHIPRMFKLKEEMKVDFLKDFELLLEKYGV